jgi:hypothetical protein
LVVSLYTEPVMGTHRALRCAAASSSRQGAECSKGFALVSAVPVRNSLFSGRFFQKTRRLYEDEGKTPGRIDRTFAQDFCTSWRQRLQSHRGLGAPTVPLPPNSYSQAWAAIDGIGCGEATGPACNGSSNGSLPTNAQLNSYLKDVNGNSRPVASRSADRSTPSTMSEARFSQTFLEAI